MNTKRKGATRSKKKVKLALSPVVIKWVKQTTTGIAILGCLVMLSLGVLQWLNKPVSKLAVVAPMVHLSEGQIKESLRGVFPSSFFYLDVDDVRSALLELPMARQVVVEKVWPDTLKVELQEEVPVARWNGSETLSHDGEVLPVVFAELDLPLLQGKPEDRQMVMHHYHLFNQWGRAYDLSWIGIKYSLAGWQLVGEKGLSVWLDANDALNGLQRLGSIISRLNLANVNSIDLRYEQGFAVSWKPVGLNESQNGDDKENEA